MSWYGHGSMMLECPECCFYSTARGLYWHLVKEHGFDRDAAYDLVGCIIDEIIVEKSREKNRAWIDSFCKH